MPIRQLPETVINQIAAGEVVERPASVVKELVENALDAGANHIEVVSSNGGLDLIRVIDDGNGIEADQLTLAISRHCTSKLGDDVHHITALGFRGEALPSIGSVARVVLRSRPRGADQGAEILVEGGQIEGPRPAAGNQGTLVEVRDLFFNTPARLKFMKSARAEQSAITDMVKRLAIAYPKVRFTLAGGDRLPVDYPACGDDSEGQKRRLSQVLGQEFSDNVLALDCEREGVRLTGFTGISSYHRGNAQHQFFHVNGRPVRDKMLGGALRAAYQDIIPRGRYPVAVLELVLDEREVDVNVHPAKADVRFRDSGRVRGLIIGGIRQALTGAGLTSSSAGAAEMLGAFRTQPPSDWQSSRKRPAKGYDWRQSLHAPEGFAEQKQSEFTPFSPGAQVVAIAPEPETFDYQLGAARAQVHENYIVAQTNDSLILVDQHAAHERLVYEALKSSLHAKPLTSQMLLLPEVIDLPDQEAEFLAEHADDFARFGLLLERFGPGAVAVRATPAILGEVDVHKLLTDLVDDLASLGGSAALRDHIDRVAATMACHGSVRSGRRLKVEEMNALLRQMEAVPESGTCNHGRPTYIELKLNDIERLFGRR